jgi:hypothetical protein
MQQDDRRELVEQMALQSLFRWPGLAREIGITAEHWRTTEAGRRLAGAGLDVVFPRADGSLPLTNTAAAAGVPLEWVRERFTATLRDPAQGRAWLGELADIEEARILREQVEGAFRSCAPGDLGDALSGIVRGHQQRQQGQGTASVTSMAEIAQAFIADQVAIAQAGGAMAIPLSPYNDFPALTRIMRGGWHPETTCILAGPGTGKSTLCEHFRRLIAEQGHHSLLFSGEMPSQLLGERFVHAECRAPMAYRLQIEDILEASRRIAGSPTAGRMHVYEDGILVPEKLWLMVETMRARLGSLGLIAIDHIARVRRQAYSGAKDWEVIHQASTDVAMLVKSLRVPTLLLAHMTTNAGAQTDSAWEPDLGCIAGGIKLANDVGNLFAVWRNPMGTWLKVLKCRMNGTAVGEKIALRYHPETQSYAEEC